MFEASELEALSSTDNLIQLLLAFLLGRYSISAFLTSRYLPRDVTGRALFCVYAEWLEVALRKRKVCTCV